MENQMKNALKSFYLDIIKYSVKEKKNRWKDLKKYTRPKSLA